IGAPVLEPTHVVDGDDVGRTDAPEQPRLLEEAGPDLLLVGELAVQYLDRDQGLQLLVPGLDDDREPASRYLLADLIATDIGRQRHSRGDPLQVAADVHALKDLDVENIVIAVGGTDAEGLGIAPDLGRCGALRDLGGIVGHGVPLSLLYLVDRLGIVADLLDREVLSPPDVDVILRYVGREVGLQSQLDLVAGALHPDDLDHAA